jgi:hypothetical protein
MMSLCLFEDPRPLPDKPGKEPIIPMTEPEPEPTLPAPE